MDLWKDIPGYDDNYQASNRGHIRSKKRVVFKRHRSGVLMQQTYPEKILQGTLGRNGYSIIHISIRGIKQQVGAHRLVLLAFIGPCPLGMEACHKNSIPNDNEPENLYWGTHEQNMRDRKNRGKYPKGKEHPMRKLSPTQAKSIMKSSEVGRVLAKKYNIGTSQISRIKRGKSWQN